MQVNTLNAEQIIVVTMSMVSGLLTATHTPVAEARAAMREMANCDEYWDDIQSTLANQEAMLEAGLRVIGAEDRIKPKGKPS